MGLECQSGLRWQTTNMFYVTLPSNSSHKYFPQNTLTHYTTQLPQPIHLSGDWECGLVEIQYPRTWYVVHQDEVRYTLEHTDAAHKNKHSILTLEPGYYASANALAKALMAQLRNTNDTALQDHADDVAFTFDEVSGTYSIKTKTSMALGLSPRLQELMNLPYGWIAPQTNLLRVGSADLKSITPTLYVYTDIIEPRVVGDVMAPLLRLVPAKGKYGTHTAKTFQHVEHIPLRTKDFTTIHIDIRDDTGEPIPFEYGKVVVTLHFRQRRALPLH